MKHWYEESCSHWRALLWPAVLSFSQTPRVHDLKLLPQNVHWGYYDAGVKPVLRVASGDTIRVETMVARGLQRLRAAGVAEAEIPDALKAVETADHRTWSGRTSFDRSHLDRRR